MNKFLLGIGITIFSAFVLKVAYDVGQFVVIRKIYANGWKIVDPSVENEEKDESSGTES